MAGSARPGALAAQADAQLIELIGEFDANDAVRWWDGVKEHERRLTWTERESGTVDVRLRLPKEEAATFLAALNAAKDRYGPPPDPSGAASSIESTEKAPDTTPTYTSADAALAVARVFLATAREDRSGEERTLVVVHVNADQLADEHRDQSSGDVRQTTEPGSTEQEQEQEQESVPAGTQTEPPTELIAHPSSPTCHVQGPGGVEPETAGKLACDADLLGTIIDAHADVLALGRTRRLVSQAQRRALMIRDQGMCQFTGCHQTRHLKAHHLIHWFDGGPTDLDKLVLLCQFHHTAVHEGQMIIRRVDPASRDTGAVRRWEFLMPDGTPHRHWWSAEGLLNFLEQHADRGRAEHERARRRTAIDDVRSFHHPDARRIQPGWRGERYDRHEAVQALFRMPVRDQIPAAA